MKFIAIITMVFLMTIACGQTVHKGASDFSGEWALNLEKSDMGGPRGGERGRTPGEMLPPDLSKAPRPDSSGMPGPDQGKEPGFDRDRRFDPDRGNQPPREGRRGGMRMGMGGSKMIVVQKDNELAVETLFPNPEGEEFSIKSTYTLDGKKSKNDSNFGTRVSTATWSKDGKTLTIESIMTMFRDDQEFSMESIEKWSLDGNMLTIETTRSTPMGDRTSKAVYDRTEKE